MAIDGHEYGKSFDQTRYRHSGKGSNDRDIEFCENASNSQQRDTRGDGSCIALVLVTVIVAVAVYAVSLKGRKIATGPGLEEISRLPFEKMSGIGDDGSLMHLVGFNRGAFSRLRHSEPFEARPTDIFLVGVMGSGTTWLSQIVHGLRSNGSMAFNDIHEAVPWFHAAYACGQNLDADQNYTPRLFKSHKQREMLPDGAKFIVLLREPKDVLVSQYARFCDGNWAEYAKITPGAISLEHFAAGSFAHRREGNDIWHFLLSWYKCCAGDENVLWLTYEDLVEDTDEQIKRIGAFVNSERYHVSQKLLEKVKSQSTREFMIGHASKFDEHFVLSHLSSFREIVRGGGYPHLDKALPNEEKVQDKVGPGTDIANFFDTRWAELVQPSTGLRSYEELRDSLGIRPRPLHRVAGHPKGGQQSPDAFVTTIASSSTVVLGSILLCFGFAVTFLGIKRVKVAMLRTELQLRVMLRRLLNRGAGTSAAE
eukprot:TRINITY_DN12932_c0_g1_i1.p1 TRINITY_DN12932_c0_g1~~TRINITY_DN12932_c0_g1_i1.p1  ORF type:complete len:481 (+),score=73.00 TRINITY_DN12932_c0_g1_i1:60-1502(+)